MTVDHEYTSSVGDLNQLPLVPLACGLDTILPDGLTVEGLILRALGLVPGMIGQYMLRQRLERLQKFGRDLQERITGIEVKLDEASFAFLVEKAAKIAVQDHREFKRAMLGRILTDAAMHTSSVVSEARLFIDLVDAIEPYHIALIKRILESRDGDEQDENLRHWVSYSSLTTVLCADDCTHADAIPALTTAALSFLSQQGILSCKMNRADSGKVMLNPNPIGLFKMAVYRLTSFGQRFVAHFDTDADRNTGRL